MDNHHLALLRGASAEQACQNACDTRVGCVGARFAEQLFEPRHDAETCRLRLSRTGEARVTAIAGPFNLSLNTVSKHIRILERARLVRRRRAGREHLLSHNRKPLDDVAAWIESTRVRWDAAFDRLERALADECDR